MSLRNFESPPCVCQLGIGWICISLSFQAEISFNLSRYPIVSVSSMLVGGTNIVYLCAGLSLCHVIMLIMCSRELLSLWRQLTAAFSLSFLFSWVAKCAGLCPARLACHFGLSECQRASGWCSLVVDECLHCSIGAVVLLSPYGV